jgi:hypothetical protein
MTILTVMQTSLDPERGAARARRRNGLPPVVLLTPGQAGDSPMFDG